MGFSCQRSEALVIFIYIIVFHPQVFDLHSCFGVTVGVQEPVVEGVQEVEPGIWFFTAGVEGIALNSDEISD